MLMRHCDVCNTAMEKNQIFIKVSFEVETPDSGGVVSGLPIFLEGDFCSYRCLKENVNRESAR